MARGRDGKKSVQEKFEDYGLLGDHRGKSATKRTGIYRKMYLSLEPTWHMVSHIHFN